MVQVGERWKVAAMKKAEGLGGCAALEDLGIKTVISFTVQ